MTLRQILAVAVVDLPLLITVAVAVAPVRWVTKLSITGAVATGVIGLTLTWVAVKDAAHPIAGTWLVIDAGGALLLGVISAVGLASIVMSGPFLSGVRHSFVGEEHRVRFYYVVLFLFWALLLAVPLAGNLAAAWLLIEATTAASALLVGFNGRRHALEAGWKYLILTSLGLGVALLGVAILTAGVRGSGVDGLAWRRLASFGSGSATALSAYLLLIVGLAAKIGWAPVHNWLPDAHSEAPPPVSALLSAALLPAVLLVAWRCERALAPIVGIHTTQRILIGFGLLSLAVAVPFLWRPMPLKRLLAYSSLEHLGVIAIGVGFGTPLALAGVAVHIAGHAVAKSLGFFTATPLIAHEPRAAQHFVTGIGRTAPVLGSTMGLSLGALSGLPPSPLFVSEVLILAGGFESGRSWAAAVAAVLLALGFLGLAHTTIETVIGEEHHRHRNALPGMGRVTALGGLSLVLLLGLTALGPWLPSSAFVSALARGLP
ncbi:MAG TPA: proton-conducting transporter membrane subunit [Acidimicrobiales bacterium]|nr:proton-conducting transporter membrane subunit [Acidimicrobiales bacterium]